MGTPLEKIYDNFYSLINIDLTKHPEMDITVEDNLVKVYLENAVYEYEENLGITLEIDEETQSILTDVPKNHIRLIARLIYKNYLERELNHALRIASHFSKPSELAVTGMQSKIVALREISANVNSELNRTFTRNIFKVVGKS